MAKKIFDNDVRIDGNLSVKERSGVPTEVSGEGIFYVDSVTKKPMFKASDGNTYELTGATGASGVNGGVFVTDVEPQSPSNNVSVTATSSGGEVVESIISDTDLIRVHVLAISGNTNYRPEVTVNGTSITNFTKQSGDTTNWEGYADIDTNSSTNISVVHEDGASHDVTVSYDVGPQVVDMYFQGGYPGTQTELKENDQYNVYVETDTPMTEVYVYNSGAAKPQVVSVSPASTSKSFNITIADRGTTTQNLPFTVKCKNANGSYGADASSNDGGGSTNGTHTVKLNNSYPVISIGSVDYPANQGALKGAENATVNHTVTGSGTLNYNYNSPNGELSITSPTVYQPAKNVTRNGGGYNISTNNFRLTVTRTDNAASTVANTVVYIANTAAQITVSEPYARLRSGGNDGTSVQSYTISLNSDQLLYEAPTLDVGAEAAWAASSTFSGSGQNWTNTLRVHDDDAKGTYNWGALYAKNLAGQVTTVLTGNQSYTLGGFVYRVLTIPAFANSVELGTYVADFTKVRCTNLSLSGAGLWDCVRRTNKANNSNSFTIVDGYDGAYDVNGNWWFNCDQANVSSNTAGTATFEIEETV